MRRLAWLGFTALLLGATLAAYQPVWRGGVLWDDAAHMTKPELRSGGGLWRIWFEPGATQQYYPLTHSAFWVQYQLWGDNTLGYHLVNICLHVAAALLLVLILRRLNVPGAWLAGIIFALHPVQVESVAWITELKNLLSGVLYLGAALAYLSFNESRRKTHYALALGLFVMALLSKTVAATLPAALLVVFWWRRGRLEWRRDVLPLTPFFLLGAVSGLFTAWTEYALIGAEGAEFEFTIMERGLIAGRVIWFYLGKLVWPTNLMFIYPRWKISQAVWWQYLFPLGVIGLLAGLWLLRKRIRAPLAAALLFCGTLFPVLGFFNVYPFRFSFVADHFQYLASLAILSLFSAGVALLMAQWRRRSPLIKAAVGLLFLGVLGVVGVLGALSWRQCRQYVDIETLYRETLKQNPDCWMAKNNLAIMLSERGEKDAAILYYQQILQIKSDYAEAHGNLANELQAKGRTAEATEHYLEAIRLGPRIPEPHFNFGKALADLGQFGPAIEQFNVALQLRADYSEAHTGLGNVLQKLGRPELALQHYQAALRRPPNKAVALCNLGSALQDLGQHDLAIRHFREALELKPDFPECHYNLGNSLRALGQNDKAINEYQEALRLKADLSMAHNNWGGLLMQQGRLQDASVHFRAALTIQPDNKSAKNNLKILETMLPPQP
ncbi:MAG: tetratricopeptide repeat protein [Planctomycetes bacterium]|nr:tetratricopeptide repeat protein [Planctomycetota bacterium]